MCRNMSSQKLADNVDRGLWSCYGHPADYVAVASSVDTYTGTEYQIRYHQGEMPAFAADRYTTLAELEAAMRKVQPDMRRWRLVDID